MGWIPTSNEAYVMKKNDKYKFGLLDAIDDIKIEMELIEMELDGRQDVLTYVIQSLNNAIDLINDRISMINT